MNNREDQLLHHLPEFRLVICQQCGYAVQPSAISNHLKDRHHIYRQNRKDILDALQAFDLANPTDVVLPRNDRAPVPYLPVELGFACSYESCGYLSITLKRMRMHWSKAHGRPARAEIDWRRVSLQTFFRGVHLRYFEVTPPVIVDVSARQTTATIPSSEETLRNGESNFLSLDNTALRVGRHQSAETFDIEDFQLWHQYITSTSLTLCPDSHFTDYWTVLIPQMTIGCVYLMRMVLALTSMQLAHLHPGKEEKYVLMAEIHHEFASVCFDEVRENADSGDAQMTSAFYKLLTIQQHASVSLVRHCSLETQANDTMAQVVIAIRSGYSWISLNPTHETGVSVSSLNDHNCDLPCVDENQLEFTRRLSFPNGFPETNAEQDRICYDAFRELQRANKIAEKPSNLSDAFVYWPSRVSDSYLLLLSLQHPTSLIIFGHFCRIVKLLDQYWYMNGHANWLLRRVRRFLDVRYHTMLPQIAN